jgi:hypothetical protein
VGSQSKSSKHDLQDKLRTPDLQENESTTSIPELQGTPSKQSKQETAGISGLQSNSSKQGIQELPETVSKHSKQELQKKPSENTSQAGLPAGWVRGTFIVREVYLEKLKAVAYWERKQIKEVADEALAAYLTGKNVEPIPARKGNR